MPSKRPELGPVPPSAAMLGGIKPTRDTKPSPKARFRQFDGQEPIKTGDKTGNRDTTTPMEAIMDTHVEREQERSNRNSREQDKGESFWKKDTTPSLSKSALRDIQDIKSVGLSKESEESEIKQVVHKDVVAQGRGSKALDVLVVGGAFIVVLATGYIVLEFVSSLMVPAPMPKELPAAA
jgi:hypothetical protein